jgi:ABC-type Fe3+-hydroxamate transport system substrate-binding protein
MKKRFKDQLGREIEINFPPKRIISLVPSQTELLFDLGLDIEIVGITKFCIHPEAKIKNKVKIGGTKTLNLELIKHLKPDLIIGNKEENVKADIEQLMLNFPVWMSDVNTLEQATGMITQFGQFLDREPESAYLNHLIQSGFADLQQLAINNSFNKKVAYFIWKEPYMFAGKNTFIDDILRIAGFINVVETPRYPKLSLAELCGLSPEILFLSSEPYPFKEKHVMELKSLMPNTNVLMVDGEMFSWYGSRLLRSVEYLFHLQNALS